MRPFLEHLRLPLERSIEDLGATVGNIMNSSTPDQVLVEVESSGLLVKEISGLLYKARAAAEKRKKEMNNVRE